MRIAIFNWRDIKNPRAGGAELVTHEVAKRLVQKGHEVILFTAAFPKAKEEETVDGVKIVRRGSQWTIHLYAFFFYHKQLKGKIDVVIDEVNTIPFFTPLYVREKKVAYFNQLCRQIWFYEQKWPISLIGYLIEPLYLLPYRNLPTITISNSSKKELEKFGFSNISIFPMAVAAKKSKDRIVKTSHPSILFLGRLVPSKRVDHVIRALPFVLQKFPNVELRIVGSGNRDYVKTLEKLINKFQLEKNVALLGFVAEKEKSRLIGESWIIAVTSVYEGWGLIVTEAAIHSTPAVVYDVAGIRD